MNYTQALAEIRAGRAQARPLWMLLSRQDQRDGFALRPETWEGAGEYQHVIHHDGRSVLVRLPEFKTLPTSKEGKS